MLTWIVRSKNSPFGNKLPAVNINLMYPKSLSIEFAILGNWIFTATPEGEPVGEAAGESVAVCTWPMEAAAKGSRSKDVNNVAHFGPRESERTL